MLVDQFTLATFVVVAHFPGVDAITGGLFLVGHRHFDKLGAERFDLFLGGRAHVEGFDHGTKALGGRDGLQAGDADAENQHPSRFYGTGGGHHHRHHARVVLGGQQHGAIAAEVVLAGQDVHRLRTRGPRQQFHGESADLLRRQLRQQRVLVRLQLADEDGTGFQRGDVRSLRLAHGQHDVAAAEQCRAVGDDFRPGLAEHRIRHG